MPDAPIAVSDRDGDGVPDVSDNCPDTKNADQANEDTDKFGDACDFCPQLAETTQVDTDGDGIGNACDPNSARDSVWLFEGFHKGMPAWPGTTNWTPVGDKLRVIAPGNTNNDGGYLVLPLTSPGRVTFDNFSVTTTVLAEQMTGTNGDHSFGVAMYDGTANNGNGNEVDCDLDQSAGSGSVLFLEDDNNVIKKQTFTWTTGTEYRLSLVRHGTTYTCSVVGPGGTSVTAMGTSQLAPRTGADMSIWAYGVTAQFGSVQVIGP